MLMHVITRFFKDKEGNVVIFQWPNIPLVVGIVSSILARILPYGTINFIAALVAFGALFTWAWLEIFEGVNWFRRLLGIVVMVLLVKAQI